jgi:hypothetical protein
VPTKKGEWLEVKVPLDKFEATSFGRPVKDAGAVKPEEVNALGFMLGDKKAGPFKMEIEWIKLELPLERESASTVRAYPTAVPPTVRANFQVEGAYRTRCVPLNLIECRTECDTLVPMTTIPGSTGSAGGPAIYRRGKWEGRGSGNRVRTPAYIQEKEMEGRGSGNRVRTPSARWARPGQVRGETRNRGGGGPGWCGGRRPGRERRARTGGRCMQGGGSWPQAGEEMRH